MQQRNRENTYPTRFHCKYSNATTRTTSHKLFCAPYFTTGKNVRTDKHIQLRNRDFLGCTHYACIDFMIDFYNPLGNCGLLKQFKVFFIYFGKEYIL